MTNTTETDLIQNYRLIKGSDNDIAKFEQQVSQAIEEGYCLGSELVTKQITAKNGEQELVLLQPMLYDDNFDFDEDSLLEDLEELEETGEIYS